MQSVIFTLSQGRVEKMNLTDGSEVFNVVFKSCSGNKEHQLKIFAVDEKSAHAINDALSFGSTGGAVDPFGG